MTISLPPDDPTRFALVARELYTPVIGDVLDVMGRRHQYLGPHISPLHAAMTLVGRAMPVLLAPVFGPQRQPFGKLTDALDQLAPGEVYLARGAEIPAAAWGEILTATAKQRGAAGAVIDGYHRDTARVLAQNWPVFSHGPYGQDAGVRSVVVDYRVPVEIDGVCVAPGDLVIGDVDGVVCVPANIEAEVLQRALDKASAENLVRAEIEHGATSTAAFAKYGVL